MEIVICYYIIYIIFFNFNILLLFIGQELFVDYDIDIYFIALLLLEVILLITFWHIRIFDLRTRIW
ncbi:hypothetical protein NARC_150048 [Candidatus Nitrosocosmicus arcticus]|uniref:Uncharacterized protein n=1 Tax=Candidatus Nitrosocosmicus arcticus TaxID=2035267 RepID=A0A557SS66_9ARCH|nr:hypothetical protein NARC_150048 [Candidatus Nitrosocosmicus arcticus]